jgi:metal-dependent amidase/aminoacylase/carboxypeptidase family protein
VNTTPTTSESVLRNLDRLIPELEALYKDLHAHPELSMQETRTAGLAADWLRKAGYEVTTGVGKGSWVCCVTGMGRRSCCAPTWMRSPSKRQPVSLTPAK